MSQDPRIGDVAIPTPLVGVRPQPIALPTVAMPAAVADAFDADNRVIAKADEVSDAVKVAQRDAKQAVKDDVIESADLVAAGKPPLPSAKRTEAKAQAKVSEAEHQRAVVYTAGHSTRRQLADAVIDHRDAWLADVQAQADEHTLEARAALADLKTALQRLQAARGNVAWLDHVDVVRRKLPDHVATGRLDITVSAGRNGAGAREYPVGVVLTALGLAIDPPPKTVMVSKGAGQPRRVPA